MTTATQPCFLCRSSSYRELLRINRPDRFEEHLQISPEGYSRVWEECLGCGLAYNRHSAQVFAKLDQLSTHYYEVDFAGGSIRDKFDKVMALSPEQSDNAQRVSRINAFLTGEIFRSGTAQRSVRRVLDIGAGTGVFLTRFLREAPGSWEGTGIEPDPHASAHLRSLELFQVIEGLFTGQKELGTFHLCTLNKVAEHLKDPLSLLKLTKQVLRQEDGVLYIEVPDKATCTLRPPTDNILGAFHYHLYDMQSLTRLLETAGFEVMSVLKTFDPSGKITVAAFAVQPETARCFARREGKKI